MNFPEIGVVEEVKQEGLSQRWWKGRNSGRG